MRPHVPLHTPISSVILCVPPARLDTPGRNKTLWEKEHAHTAHWPIRTQIRGSLVWPTFAWANSIPQEEDWQGPIISVVNRVGAATTGRCWRWRLTGWLFPTAKSQTQLVKNNRGYKLILWLVGVWFLFCFLQRDTFEKRIIAANWELGSWNSVWGWCWERALVDGIV